MSPHVFQKTLQGALGKLGSEGENNPIAALNLDIAQNNDIDVIGCGWNSGVALFVNNGSESFTKYVISTLLRRTGKI